MQRQHTGKQFTSIMPVFSDETAAIDEIKKAENENGDCFALSSAKGRDEFVITCHYYSTELKHERHLNKIEFRLYSHDGETVWFSTMAHSIHLMLEPKPIEIKSAAFNLHFLDDLIESCKRISKKNKIKLPTQDTVDKHYHCYEVMLNTATFYLSFDLLENEWFDAEAVMQAFTKELLLKNFSHTYLDKMLQFMQMVNQYVVKENLLTLISAYQLICDLQTCLLAAGRASHLDQFNKQLMAVQLPINKHTFFSRPDTHDVMVAVDKFIVPFLLLMDEDYKKFGDDYKKFLQEHGDKLKSTSLLHAIENTKFSNKSAQDYVKQIASDMRANKFRK